MGFRFAAFTAGSSGAAGCRRMEMQLWLGKHRKILSGMRKPQRVEVHLRFGEHWKVLSGMRSEEASVTRVNGGKYGRESNKLSVSQLYGSSPL